jgi:hypothetical protein
MRVLKLPEKTKDPVVDGYLGTIPVVLSSRKAQHNHVKTRKAVLNITGRKFETLSRAQGPMQLTLVERGAKENVRKPIRVTAADSHFTVADVGQ